MTSNKENQTNTGEMQDFESNAIALYNQQIIQILCSDTLELEIELARDLVSGWRRACSERSSVISSGSHRSKYHHHHRCRRPQAQPRRRFPRMIRPSTPSGYVSLRQEDTLDGSSSLLGRSLAQCDRGIPSIQWSQSIAKHFVGSLGQRYDGYAPLVDQGERPCAR